MKLAKRFRGAFRRLMVGATEGEDVAAVPFGQVFRRFWPHARPYRRLLSLVLFWAVLFEAVTAEVPFNAEYEETGSDDEPGSTDETGTDEWTSTNGTGTDRNLEDYEQLTRRADPVRAHRRVPAAFNDIVVRCLDPDPGARPTVAELTNTLRALT